MQLTTSNIFCIWYPSGGFGHFVNAILSLYGENFARPTGQLIFSPLGNSHSLDLVAPKYMYDTEDYKFNFDNHHLNYTVLVDIGIGNKSEKFRTVFPQAQIIRICYTDYSWPIVARTMIEKAMRSTITEQLPSWGIADWTVREKYFLFLRDHKFRSAWCSTNDFALYVENLLDYKEFYNTLTSFDIKLEHFKPTWHQWRKSNAQYIDPVETAQSIVNTLDQHNQDLSGITDIWTQAVVYYFIWIKFGVEVPHNDYLNWFTNTKEIVTMLKDHGVYIDTD